MKLFKMSLIVFFAVFFVFCLCSGVVTALNSDQASVRALVSNPQPRAGETITVTVFFENNYTDQLKLTFVGLHFDWMPSEGFLGFNLSSTPISVAAGDDYVFQQPITVKVPAGLSGVHTYFVGVEGTLGASSDAFSLDSATAELMITDNSQTIAPTNTNSDGQQGGVPNLLLYGAVAAVVVIVAVLIIVLMLRKKRKPAEKTAQPVADQPAPSKPEQKPSSGQDFSI
jgi:hypothetical protein